MKAEFNLEALSPGGSSSASQDSKLLYIFTGPQICSVQCYPSEPSISRPELLHCKQHVLCTAFTSSTSGAATPQEQQYLLPHSDQIPQAASLQAKPTITCCYLQQQQPGKGQNGQHSQLKQR